MATDGTKPSKFKFYHSFLELNFEFAPKQASVNFDDQICPKPSVTSENPEISQDQPNSLEEVKTQICMETRLYECESKV